MCNNNGKIWVFWNHDVDCNILEKDDQQITCELQHTKIPHKFISTFVYAKCRDHLRRPLWEKILHLSNRFSAQPWYVVGDFNVITNTDENLGGIPYNMKKILDFISVIEGCGLIDLGFARQKYIWSNNREIMFSVWKRLDRAMVNDKWLELMPQTISTHLPTVSSDHCPLLLKMSTKPSCAIKYFKFLNFWTEQPSFLEIVKEYWDRPTIGNPIWVFHQKMRRLSATLSSWSKAQFRDIHAKMKPYEERIKNAEKELITLNTDVARSYLHSLNAEYIRFLKLEESILRQKSQLHWFKEGDANTG